MRLLLDTHALVWWFSGEREFPTEVRNAARQPGSTLYVSSATAWEIGTKVRLGKMPSAAWLVSDYFNQLAESGFVPLDITSEHALLAGQIDAGIKDPFDRMIAAQAQVEKLKVVTIDPAIKALGAETIW